MPDAPTVEAPPAAPVAPEISAEPPKGYEEAFGAIDALGRDEGTPAPLEQPSPGDGRVRGPDGKFLPKGEKVPEKPVAAAPKPDDDIDPTKLKTSELAKHYHKLKSEQKEWLKEREELSKKAAAPKEWPEKKTWEERVAERDKALEEHKKRVAEYETELQFTNFTKSQAYKDQFQKPYVESWKTGQARAASMKVIERKGDEGEMLQQSRQGTAADFDSIMSISEDDLAAEKATELFGNKASIILHHREKIRDIQGRSDAAIQEYQEKGQAWEKERREATEKQSKDFEGQITLCKQESIKKYSRMFTPDDSDPREKELAEKGKAWVARMIAGRDMAPEERAMGISAMQLKAEHGDLWMYRADKFSKRVKELEKELEQFKSSRPANGNGNGRAPAAEEKDPLQMIAAMGKER